MNQMLNTITHNVTNKYVRTFKAAHVNSSFLRQLWWLETISGFRQRAMNSSYFSSSRMATMPSKLVL